MWAFWGGVSVGREDVSCVSIRRGRSIVFREVLVLWVAFGSEVTYGHISSYIGVYRLSKEVAAVNG